MIKKYKKPYQGGYDKNARVLANTGLQLLNMPMATSGSTSQKVTVKGNVLSTEQDLTEVVTNELSNLNYLTFPVSPANPMRLGGMTPFTRLDNLGGGFLLCFNIYFSANPTGNDTLFSFQPDDTPNGGWRIDQVANGNIRFRMREVGGSLVDRGEMVLGASWRNKRVSIISYIDVKNKIWFGYARVKGVIDRQLMIDLSSLSLPVNGVQTNVGIGGLAILNGTTNALERYGEDGGNPRMSNVIMARFENDFSPYLPKLLGEYWRLPANELPAILGERQ